MGADLLLLASQLVKRGQPFALATVVRREAPSSAHVGDTGLVTHDGAFHGWVGGSCAQPTVVREALAALADHKSRLIALSPAPELDRRPGVTPVAMTCLSGGSLDIFIEPVLPAPRLLVFGVSPIARALVRLGKSLGYTVDAIDPLADAATFPEADRVFAATELQSLVDANASWLCAVVATMGQWDEDAVRAALALEPDYLGVVASRTRYAQIRPLLEEDGINKEVLSAIRNPAGLNINAERPEEIALSILAEIIRSKNSAPSKPLPVMASPEPSPAQAIDPVCGMTVIVATARHRAELGGRSWYFCAAGCRERFLREPERYGAAAASGSAG
ncbi:MAG: XdhC family protein [Longimicrobiales bacterium]